MPVNRLEVLPRMRPVVLRNVRCVYCGCDLSDGTRTKDHVVGSRFVPVGTLYQEWNLFVQACRSCNVRKSDLEDDIAAITMYPDAFGRSPSPEAAIDAQRRAGKSISRRTSKPVGKSSEQFKISGRLGQRASISFEMTGPPQIDRGRAFELARLQVLAFFYFATYDEASKAGGYWPGGFCPVMEARSGDWGNPLHIAFMNSVRQWEPRIQVNTAKDHFWAIIRRHPAAACWSWAVEWNKAYRVIGFFGEEQPVVAAATALPTLGTRVTSTGVGSTVRYRTECPIAPSDDCLFSWEPPSEA